ncbi:hypothetical protein QBC32DRAFT_389703 [Pseudoneurospora amorphoporcata]|uniref:Uncharacterized protein n=1 Tax=Pseudoneurospora amorphoporcata TaxID=241081 RepID=A0AAN6P668_9PEZI|nr:hypothetical protein QBC32DRAFT_389703 [Pseudoneurospora amorphoporcata]
MAKGIFFMSWELWQQMTFALAVAIVAVFCAGLVKLWWTNRIVRKQEILDEEKKARIDEMRSTGLRPTSSKRLASTIPFGVRAIQSGVQVDGIWISRLATPTETTKLTSTVTLVNLDAEQQRREKTKAAGFTTTSQRAAIPDGSSLLQRPTDCESLESNSSGAIPAPISREQSHYYPHRHAPRGPHALNEDTLRRLEAQDGGAQPQRPAVYDTYVPTTSSRRQGVRGGGPTRQRSTGSESRDSSTDPAQQRFTRSGSGRSYSSSSGGGGGGGGGGRLYGPRRDERGGTAVRDPFGTPSSHMMYQQQQQPQQHGQDDEAESMIPAPEPTFGPGDLHFTNNRSAARRVNDGFEVLPVGRLGTPGTERGVNQYHLSDLEAEEGGEKIGYARGSSVPGYGRR